MQLEKLTVRGYKSIRELENFPLRSLNVLIGANGAGKSNLISLFRVLAALAHGNLQEYVQLRGGPDTLLHGGRKRTKQLEAEFAFGRYEYRITLEPTADNRLIFKRETVATQHGANGEMAALGTLTGTLPHTESNLPRLYTPLILSVLQGWRVYHFHDTGEAAAVKVPHASNDNLVLKPDAGNLAAYLARLKNGNDDSRAAYERIVDTVQLAAPFFGGFVVREPLPKTVELEWTERGDPETPLRAHLLSDGTLRFICLATLLLQPAELLPDTVLIDEPELGLHPYAVNLLAEMIRQVAETKQVIVSTQSVELLNHFEPEDVIVVERGPDGASTFRRPDGADLADWLENYTLGELWQRNILGGRPTFARAAA